MGNLRHLAIIRNSHGQRIPLVVGPPGMVEALLREAGIFDTEGGPARLHS